MTPEHHEERLLRWAIKTKRPVLSFDYGKVSPLPLRRPPELTRYSYRLRNTPSHSLSTRLTTLTDFWSKRKDAVSE